MKQSNSEQISETEITELLKKIEADCKQGGYNLNPDDSFTRELVRGLLVNRNRYGYLACPCRLADGEKSEDLDIICPCIYRDADLNDYDACFCALYVSDAVVAGKKKAKPLPDRRETEKEKKENSGNKASALGWLSLPVWRCTVCGYLTAREAPPSICPICKVPKERFEIFINKA